MTKPVPDKHYWTVGMILEEIYKSEINLSIGWMWDGGVDYKIGADLSYIEGKGESTGEGDFLKAMTIIADRVVEEYPHSNFAKWWATFNR
jgi:hypothetical protein